MPQALTYAISLLQHLPPLIAAGIEVTGLIKRGTEALHKMALEKRDPTDEEWAELNAKADELHQRIQDA